MAGSTSASTSSPAKNAAAAQDELVLVMDFGSQTAQLITRRVRDQNVFCQLVRHDLTADRIKALNPKGLILSGGPASVYGEGSPKIDPAIFKLGIPILGICYGMQITCYTLGGRILPAHSREFGRSPCTQSSTAVAGNLLFDGIPQTFTAWMSHGDQVESLTGDFDVPKCRCEAQDIANLWPAVSSRGDSYRVWRTTAGQFCPQRLRMQGQLENQFAD
jgi:GMP synthase (glutamine-hydrolysing)